MDEKILVPLLPNRTKHTSRGATKETKRDSPQLQEEIDWKVLSKQKKTQQKERNKREKKNKSERVNKDITISLLHESIIQRQSAVGGTRTPMPRSNRS